MTINHIHGKEVVFTQKLALYLMYKGFVLQNIDKKNDSNRNIFIFNNSDELQVSINEYKSNIKSNKKLKIIFE